MKYIKITYFYRYLYNNKIAQLSPGAFLNLPELEEL